MIAVSVRDRLTGIVTGIFAFVSCCFALAMVVCLGRAAWIVVLGDGAPVAALFAAAGCLVFALVFLFLAKFDQYEFVSEPTPRRRQASTRVVRPTPTPKAAKKAAPATAPIP